MTDPPSIRTATISEAHGLVALRAAVAQDMTRRFGKGPWSASPGRPEVLRQLRASHVWVARQHGELVGTVRLVQALPRVFDSRAFTAVDNALYVLGLAVSPDRRGEGVGRRLMEAAKQAARLRHAQALWLDAYEHEAGAGDFYLKCGFRRVGPARTAAVPLCFYEWLAL